MKKLQMDDYQSACPAKWVGESFQPVDLTKQVENYLKSFADFCHTPAGKFIKGNIRRKLHTFTVTTANKPEGSSYVDVGGLYTIGPSMKDLRDNQRRLKRAVGENYVAQSIYDGLNHALMKHGFKHSANDDYPTRQQALLALEADSVGSKGPYDGSGEETALNTVNTVLENSAGAALMSTEVAPHVLQALNRRRAEYEGYVDKSYKVNFAEYVEHMRSKQLFNTMRGFPFLCSGDTPMRKEFLDATNWLFSGLPSFKFRHYNVDNLKDFTVDMFIQEVMCHLAYELKLKASDWFTPMMNLIVPISRDQGAPYKGTYKNGKYVIKERGARKYRLVTPVGAFIQAWLIMCCKDLVDAAPKTPGRIGLQEPDVNNQRFQEFIEYAESRNRVLISTDFSAYDSTLPSWLMQATGSMWATLYDDEFVKDGVMMSAVACAQKMLILPTYAEGEKGPYKEHKYWNARFIKGDRMYNMSHLAATVKNKQLRKDIMSAKDAFDYEAKIFYIPYKYLISGIIVTNTIGSDCTLHMSRDIVPGVLRIMRNQETPEHVQTDEVDLSDPNLVQAVASGDDCGQEDDLAYMQQVGYDRVLEEYEHAYSVIGMIVNAKKQLKVTINGIPLFDFLQNVRCQYSGEKQLKPYLKFMRQLPSLWYKERFSKLDLILQWSIVWGKLDSCLCEENLEFASDVVTEAGKALKAYYTKNKYRPYIPNNVWGSRNKIYFDSKFLPNASEFMGLEQFLGIVKNYGQKTLAALVHYSMGQAEAQNKKTSVKDLVNEFSQELETRAPHKEMLARSLYSNLTKQEQDEIGYTEHVTKTGTYVSLIPEFLRLWEEKSEKVIDSIILAGPKMDMEDQQSEADEAAEEDVELDSDNSGE